MSKKKQQLKIMRQSVLEGMKKGIVMDGPMDVHVDVTNSCNAKCITCWDHSPLLKTPRSAAWKRQKMPKERFFGLVSELAELGTVQSMVISGMGDPLVHPDIYEMIRAAADQGWTITVLSNLLAADIDQLCDSGVSSVLAGVQGSTPDAHTAFHPGWNESHFFTLCRYLRRLSTAGIPTKHVQVINRDTAPELIEMVRFGRLFSATRVNFKLASLYGGTEDCSITSKQRQWLKEEGIPKAKDLAKTLNVHTNLDLFESQVNAAFKSDRQTTDMTEVGCFMGHVYTRITVEETVLFCCNTNVEVGSLKENTFKELWKGRQWNALRSQIRQGRFFKGCEVCGKYEQNKKWNARFGGALHDA